MNEFFKYILDESKATAFEDHNFLSYIERFIHYEQEPEKIHYHNNYHYFFYYSGHSSTSAAIPVPYEGFTLFNPTYLYGRLERIIKSRLQTLKYFLPPNRYVYENENIVDYGSKLLAKTFPLKLREIIIDVMNENIAQDYNRIYEYALFNKLLLFDFNLFALNVDNFIKKIAIPNYNKNELDATLSENRNLIKRLFSDKEVLKKKLFEVYLQEWNLYLQSCILVYYMNIFNIQLADDTPRKILIKIKNYGRLGLFSLKNKDYAQELIHDYYYALPIRKHQRFGYRWNTEFTYAEKHFNLIDFTNLLHFNVFELNGYVNEFKRPNAGSFTIDFAKYPDYRKVLKVLITIYDDENMALFDINTWSSLEGRRFEFEVLGFFKSCLGMNGFVTKSSGDRGIDVVIDGDIAIQCKNQKQNVSSSVMREFVGSCSNKKYKTKLFITAVGYTNEAKLVAKENNIVLRTTADIINVIRGHNTKEEFFNRLFRNEGYDLFHQ